MKKIDLDKKLHFGVSAIAAFVMSLLTFFTGKWAMLCGSLFSLGLGLGKEFGDWMSPGNEWSLADFAFDLLGIAAAEGLFYLFWRFA